MAMKRVSVVVDIKAQAEQLNKIIEQSKKSLSTLSPSINPKQSQQLLSQLDTLQKKLLATQHNFATGLNSEAAFNKAAKDVKGFFETYNNTIKKINDLGIDPQSIIPDNSDIKKAMVEMGELISQQGEIVGIDLGDNISKGLNKALKKAVKQGNVEEVKKLGKEASKKLTEENRSIIAQRGQLTKIYGDKPSTSADIEKELAYQRGLDRIKQQARAQKFGRNIGQLESDLNIAKKYEGYKQNQADINTATQGYAKQASAIATLEQSIKNLTTSINQLAQPARDEAAAAMDQLNNSTGKAKTQVDDMSGSLDRAQKEYTETAQKAKQMSQIMSYFNYWFSAGTIINKLSQAVRAAIKDFSDLDKQFNEISIVTGKTMTELWDGFSNLNRIAQEYGVTTSNVVSVQKLYYQQGRSQAEVTQLTGETLKFAKISGLEFAEATNYMTASINAYKIAAEDAGKITDTFAALSAEAAVDANEVAIAMSKVASLAASAGTTFEDTSAYLSKIIETTREAPETAGTALKTIIARFTEVKDLTEEEAELLDDDFNFNKIEEALKTVGIESKDARGQMRGFSEILNDLGPIWEGLSKNQQRYIATQAAGARQQSRFIALMDDWGRTEELQSIAINSAGTGARQLALALDSIETKTSQLKATWQSFYAEFINSQAIKDAIGLANDLLDVFAKIVKIPSIGPLLVVTMIVALTKIVKLSIKEGGKFAKGFIDGWKSVYDPAKAKEHAKNIAEEYKKGYDLGVAHQKGYEMGKDATKTMEDVEEGIEGVVNGAIGGKNGKGGSQGWGMIFGQWLANSALGKNFTGLTTGFKQTLGAMKTSGMTGGKMVFGASKALAAGGAAGGTGAAIGSAIAIALPYVLAAVTAGAILVGIKKIVDKIINDRAMEAAKSVDAAMTRTDETIKKTTALSNAYNEALELQQKGLARTQEESEKYQSTLKELQSQYPQLVKTLSDGTLELSNTSGAVYDSIIAKQREQLAIDAESRKKNATGAFKLGVFNTEEGVEAQNKIKALVSNYSTYTDNELATLLGQSGIKTKNLSNLANSGLSWETLKEATGSNFNADSYEDFVKRYAENKNTANKGGAGNKQAVALFKQLEKDMGIDNLGQYLLDQIGDSAVSKAIATDWAKLFASEVGSTLSPALEEAFGKAYEEIGNEKAIEDYYHLNTETARREFEKYLDSITSDATLSDIDNTDEDSIIAMFGLTDASDIVKNAITDTLEKRNELIKTYNEQYNKITGQNLSLDEFKNKNKDLSLDEISNLIKQIAKVENKYGQNQSRNFEEAYTSYYNEVIAGNEQLRDSFSKVDVFDVSSIAAHGAEIIQLYGTAEGAYQQFIDYVNKSSNILDRSLETTSQAISNAANDVKSIKTSFEKLKDAAEGSLELEDMFDLISDSKGALDFEDFTTTADGYQLSIEKVVESKQKVIELQILEYQIEQNMAQLQNEALKIKLNELGFESAKIDMLLQEYEIYLKTGKKSVEFEKEYNKLIKQGGDTYLNSLYQNKQMIIAKDKIIEQISKINIGYDIGNTKLGKQIDKLEKLLTLLKQLEEYTDVDAYMENLSLDMAHQEFVIEFSTNIDDISQATINKMNDLNNLINANLAKSQRATQNAASYRKNLETNYGEYVSFDESGNLLTNDAAIRARMEAMAEIDTSTEEGQARYDAEEKILNTLFDQIDAYRTEHKAIKESKNAAEGYLKQIKETTKALRTSVVTMEDKFRELFIKRDEEALESLEERYDKMKELDEEYLDSVREAVEKERQLRDRTEEYEDLEKKERKLALLRMGGGSATEIQALEEEIRKSRRDLADKQQDDILDGIEEENSKRAAEMDDEVTYQKAVLEEKKKNQELYNKEIAELMKQDKETIMNTWKSLDNDYKAASDTNKALLEQNMEDIVNAGLAASKTLSTNYIPQIEDAYKKVGKEIGNNEQAMIDYGKTASKISNGVVLSLQTLAGEYFNVKNSIEQTLNMQKLLNEAMAQMPSEIVKNSEIDTTGGGVEYSGYKATGRTWETTQGKFIETNAGIYREDDLTSTGPGYYSINKDASSFNEDEIYSTITLNKGIHYSFFRDKNSGKTIVSWTGDMAGSTVEAVSAELKDGNRLYKIKPSSDLKDDLTTDPSYKDSGCLQNGYLYLNQTDLNQIMGWDKKRSIWKDFRLKQFATGGMVDFTGPAWVDGTKSKPEAFLSASDTELIASLRDILRIGISHSTPATETTQRSGDTYYEIHINVDELGEGYSVEDLIEEMEERIIEAAGGGTVTIR